MKITDVRKAEMGKLNKDYNEAIMVYAHKNNRDKQAIMINPEIDIDILLTSVSRLNQILAKSLDIPYPKFLNILLDCKNFTDKYENLNLSDEQLKKLMNKEKRGF